MNKHKMNKIKAISLTDPVAHRRSQNFERAVHQLSESHSHRQLHWWSDLLNWRALFLQCHSARPLWLLSYYRAMSWGGGRLRCHWCRPLRWPFDCDDPRFSMFCLWMNIVYLGWEFTQFTFKKYSEWKLSRRHSLWCWWCLERWVHWSAFCAEEGTQKPTRFVCR